MPAPKLARLLGDLRAAIAKEDTEAIQTLLTRAVEKLALSGRGRARAARVSATIAALAGRAEVDTEHVAEALSYRVPAEVAG